MTTVQYKIKLADKTVRYDVNTTREAPEPQSIALWTNLRFAKCARCPLDENTEVYCPVALDVQDVVSAFANISSIEEIECWVKTKERTYYKACAAQDALKSLLNLMMLTSSCPILSKFRDVATHHIPFSTSKELFNQFISYYLLLQYKRKQEGNAPDFELNGLRAIWEDFSEVTRDFTTRLRLASTNDANLNAMVALNAVSDIGAYTLDHLLSKLDPENTDGE